MKFMSGYFFATRPTSIAEAYCGSLIGMRSPCACRCLPTLILRACSMKGIPPGDHPATTPRLSDPIAGTPPRRDLVLLVYLGHALELALAVSDIGEPPSRATSRRRPPAKRRDQALHARRLVHRDRVFVRQCRHKREHREIGVAVQEYVFHVVVRVVALQRALPAAHALGGRPATIWPMTSKFAPSTGPLRQAVPLASTKWVWMSKMNSLPVIGCAATGSSAASSGGSKRPPRAARASNGS